MSFERCPNANEQCKYYDTERGCYSDEHHRYWPRRRYTASVEKIFRNLPENKDELCRAEHDEIHATERPPAKPSRSDMIMAIASQMVEAS